MPYFQTKNEITFKLRDDENRTRRRTIELDNAYTLTDDLANAMAGFMRGTVESYTYRQEQAFVGALDLGTQGDVNDKVNLIFRKANKDLHAFPVYDVHQDCFVSTSGSLARRIKDFDVLDAAADGTPEKNLAIFISNVLNGEMLVAGEQMEEYVEGYKVD